MIDRTQLTEALAYFDDTGGMPATVVYSKEQLTLMEAARMVADFPTDEQVGKAADGIYDQAVTTTHLWTDEMQNQDWGGMARAGLEAVRRSMLGDTDD